MVEIALRPFILAYQRARQPEIAESLSTPQLYNNQLRRKALSRREVDPSYGWLNINTLDFKPDSKLSK
jgi:hypothetical protein